MRLCLIVMAVLIIDAPTIGSVVDFEALADLDLVTTQFPGVTFTNAAVLTAGISFNEFKFPQDMATCSKTPMEDRLELERC